MNTKALLTQFLQLERDSELAVSGKLARGIATVIDARRLAPATIGEMIACVDADLERGVISSDLLFQARCMHACALMNPHTPASLVASSAISVFSIALNLREGSDPSEMIPLLEAAAERMESGPPAAEAVDVYANLGELYHIGGELAKAQRYLRKAATLAEGVGEGTREAIIRYNLGQIAAQDENLPSAVTELRRAVDLAQIYEVADLYAVASFTLAQVLVHLGRWDEADGVASGLGEVTAIPRYQVLILQASIKRHLAQWSEARKLIVSALEDSRLAGDTSAEGEARLQLALILQGVGKSDEANRELIDLEQVISDSGEALSLAGVLVNRANALFNTGQLAESLECASRAVALTEGSGAIEVEILALTAQGSALDELGRSSEAEQQWQQALRAGDGTGFAARRAVARGNLAGIYLRRGDTKLALEYLEAAIQESRAASDWSNASCWHMNLAELYRTTLRYHKARAQYAEAEALATRAGDKRSLGLILGAQARCLKEMGDVDGAMALYKRAVAVASRLHDPTLDRLLR